MHKLLLTNKQVSRVHKAFANNFSANIKLSRTQLHKVEHSRGFLGSLLGPLLETGLPLMKNAREPLAKSVLIPLGLTPTAAETDVAIHKNIFESGRLWDVASRTSISNNLIFSNEEKNDIMKIIKSLEESD